MSADREARHTPGPWYVNTGAALSTLSVCAESRGTGFGSSVAVCTERQGYRPLPLDEAAANARLIAAAPDLLEVLQRLVAEYEPNMKTFAENAPRKAIWQAAAAAIAAATGSRNA